MSNIYREQLESQIELYLTKVYDIRDEYTREQILSGVLAFIASNVFKEPFYPVIGVEEYQEKKWYEFWK